MPTSRVPFSPKTQDKWCVFSHKNARLRVLILGTHQLPTAGGGTKESGKFYPQKQHVFYQKIARERVSFSKKLQEKGYSFGDRVDTPAYKN